MNRKFVSRVILPILIVVEISFLFLTWMSYSNKNINEIKEVSKIDKKMFAMYIQKDDGNYEEYKDGEKFTIAGYKLNISKSNCVDNKGNAVPDIITNSNNKVTVSSNKTVFCYLYFDKDKSVYAKVVSDYQNNNGAALLSGTESDAYPVHYYTGSVTNNILYGGFCWKMVLTTETGGVKLIYNGSPKVAVETEPIEENQYVVSTNTPEDKPFTFDSSTKEWVSGIAGVNSTTNTIEFTVTESGDYILNYTVDSEKSYDKGSFYLNGTSLKSNISGTGQSGTIDLSGLTTSDVIKVTYVKDSSSAKGSDTVKFSIGKQIGEKTLSCDNTGINSQIGTSKFNSNDNSPAYVGYMYNKVYEQGNKNIAVVKSVLIQKYVGYYDTYYYGNQAIWNEETNQYDLSNSDGSEVSTYGWSSNSSNLIGYYTCMSKTEKSCEKVYYVAAGESSYMYYYEMTNGNSYDSYKIKLATNITDNGDGTYTLNNPIEVAKKDWYTNYSTYKKYYYCGDLTSTTCSDMHYSTTTLKHQIIGSNMENDYVYGNSITYSNGTYKLVNTINFWDWSLSSTLKNYHYTCFNTSGECSDVYYVHYYKTSSAFNYFDEYLYYITLDDGKTIEEALNEMLYAEDVNTKDSTIKEYIDTWYESNLLEKNDINGTLYSKYLENTIFCANREITSLGSLNPNGGSLNSSMYFKFSGLECANKTDQFTLKVEKGGIEGYGNNALDYPIGLLNAQETVFLTGSHFLDDGLVSYSDTGEIYRLISPARFGARMGGFTPTGHTSLADNPTSSEVSTSYGVRPALSLSNQVEITGGDGSVANPYQVRLPN